MAARHSFVKYVLKEEWLFIELKSGQRVTHQIIRSFQICTPEFPVILAPITRSRECSKIWRTQNPGLPQVLSRSRQTLFDADLLKFCNQHLVFLSVSLILFAFAN